MARKCHLEMARPTLEDTSGDLDRVLSALGKCLLPEEQEKVQVSLALIRRISRTLRKSDFRPTAVLARGERQWEVIDLLEGHAGPDCLGLALDVGTTTLSLYLVNMTTGEIIARKTAENPQVAHGEDILSRIHFCQRAGGLRRLQELVVKGINGAVVALAEARGLRPEDIFAVSAAGNPAMTHLLLGLDPYHLCREPYVPVVGRPLLIKAKELMLKAHPEAPAYVFPTVGSYFGGDVVAGILASGMHNKSGVSMLVDVGTNAEIVLGNRDWLAVCAGAAGPALETGGAKAGMRALEGAIERVRIDENSLEPTIEVIGGSPARGICGSGLIDLVAELFRTGAIDPKGRISGRRHTRRIRVSGGVKAYAVVLAEEGEGPKDILVDELDIGNLLRAKGAMYTALTLISERLGIGFNQLESFFVAGSFGEHIDPRNAVTIGMLPDIPLERFKILGNSAGLGACLPLVSNRSRAGVEYIRRKATYLQLTTDNEFMSRLNAAIFIPHTERELFPSVSRRA